MCRLGELDLRPRDEAVLQLLAPPLFRQVMDHPEVGEQLRKLPCIPTASGALSAPKALFDPRNGQLAEALGSQAALPAEPFTSNQVWTIDAMHLMLCLPHVAGVHLVNENSGTVLCEVTASGHLHDVYTSS